MAAPVFYRVHEANVLAYNAPGREVYDLIDDTGKAAQYHARNNVNDRTGKLGRSIRNNKPKPEGGFRIAALVYTNVGYAHYVHEGTHDRTPKPRMGRYMTVPSERQGGGINPSGAAIRKDYLAGGSVRDSAGRKPYFLAKRISGQDANPFLADGMREAMAGDARLGFSGLT